MLTPELLFLGGAARGIKKPLCSGSFSSGTTLGGNFIGYYIFLGRLQGYLKLKLYAHVRVVRLLVVLIQLLSQSIRFT